MKKKIKVVLFVALLALILPVFVLKPVTVIALESEEEVEEKQDPIVNNEEEEKKEEVINNEIPQNNEKEEKQEPIITNEEEKKDTPNEVINEEQKNNEEEKIEEPVVINDEIKQDNQEKLPITNDKNDIGEDTPNQSGEIHGDKPTSEPGVDSSVVVTSQIYHVSSNAIYTGFQSFNINSISVSGDNGPYTMEYSNYILSIKNGNDTVKQYYVISLTLNNYTLNSNTIEITGEFNFDNVNVLVDTNKYNVYKSTTNSGFDSFYYVALVYNNSTLSVIESGCANGGCDSREIDSYAIVQSGTNELVISSQLYVINNNFKFIYTGFQAFNINNVIVNSPYTKEFNNNILTIKNGNEIIEQYDVISLTINIYDYNDQHYIVMLDEEFNWNNINVVANNSYSIFKGSMPDPYTFNGKFIALTISDSVMTVVKGEYQPNDGGDMSIDSFPIFIEGGDSTEDLITITLDLNGGTGINQNNFTIAKGQTIMDIMSSYNLGNVEIYYPDRSKEFVGFVDASQNNVALNAPIYEDLTIYAKWQNLTPVSYIDITIEPPTIDDEVEINGQGEPSNIPEIEWNENSGYGTHNPRYVILQNGEYEPLFEGIFKENTDYYVRIDLFPEDGYYLSDDTFDNITINGLLPSYVYIDRTNDIYYVVQAMQAEFGVGDTGLIPITFYNESASTTINVEYGKKLNEYIPLGNYNNIFEGWYYDTSYVQKFDFNTKITESFNLYAKWSVMYYSDNYIVQDGIIYTGFKEFDKDYIYGDFLSSYDKDNRLFTIIDNNGNVIKEYAVVTLSTDEYLVNNGSIIVNNNLNLSKINVLTNSNVRIYRNTDPEQVLGKFISLKLDNSGTYLYVLGGEYTEEAIAQGGLGDIGLDQFELLYPRSNTVFVAFDLGSNYGDGIEPIEVNKGNRINEPVLQLDSCDAFDGWYTDPELTNKFNFGSQIYNSMILYGSFINIYNYNENTVRYGDIIFNKFSDYTTDFIYVSSTANKEYTKEYANNTLYIKNGNNIVKTFNIINVGLKQAAVNNNYIMYENNKLYIDANRDFDYSYITINSNNSINITNGADYSNFYNQQDQIHYLLVGDEFDFFYVRYYPDTDKYLFEDIFSIPVETVDNERVVSFKGLPYYVELDPIKVNIGSTIDRPIIYDYLNNNSITKLLDWYTDPELTNVYDFNLPIYQNIALYSKWITIDTVEYDLFDEYTLYTGFNKLDLDKMFVEISGADYYETVRSNDEYVKEYENNKFYLKHNDEVLFELDVISLDLENANYYNTNYEEIIAYRDEFSTNNVIINAPYGIGISKGNIPSQTGRRHFNVRIENNTFIASYLYKNGDVATINKYYGLIKLNPASYIVTYEFENNRRTVSIPKGQRATNLNYSDEDSYLARYYGLLLGWYTDPELNNEFNFNTPINSDITLYPKQHKIVSKTDKFENNGVILFTYFNEFDPNDVDLPEGYSYTYDDYIYRIYKDGKEVINFTVVSLTSEYQGRGKEVIIDGDIDFTKFHIISNNKVLLDYEEIGYGDINLPADYLDNYDYLVTLSNSSGFYNNSNDIYISTVFIYNNSVNDISYGLSPLKVVTEFSEEEIPKLEVTSITYTIYDNSNIIFTGFNEFNINDLTITNGFTTSFNNNVLTIKYNDETIKEYHVITLSLTNYELDNEVINIGNDNSFNFNNINVMTSNRFVVYKDSSIDPFSFNGEYIELNVSNNNLSIIYGRNEVGVGGLGSAIATYQIQKDTTIPELVVQSNIYMVDDSRNIIFTGFNEFNLNNLTITNGYTTSFNNNVLTIKYNDTTVREYDVVTLSLSNYELHNNVIDLGEDESFNFNNINVTTSNRIVVYKNSTIDQSTFNGRYIEIQVDNTDLVIVYGENEVGTGGIRSAIEFYQLQFKYKLPAVEVTSNMYSVDPEANVIFTGFNGLAINNFAVNNPYTLSIDNTNKKLLVIYENETVKEFDIISLTLSNYRFENNTVVTNTDEFDFNNVNVVTSSRFNVYKESLPNTLGFEFVLIKLENNNLVVEMGRRFEEICDSGTLATYNVINENDIKYATYIELNKIIKNEVEYNTVYAETDDAIEFLLENADTYSFRFTGNKLFNDASYYINQNYYRTTSWGHGSSGYGGLYSGNELTTNYVSFDTVLDEEDNSRVDVHYMEFSNNGYYRNYEFYNTPIQMMYNGKLYNKIIIHFYDPTPALEAVTNLDSVSLINGKYNIEITSRNFDDIYENIKVTKENLYDYCWQYPDGSYYCGQQTGESLEDETVLNRIIDEKNRDNKETMISYLILNQIESALNLDGYTISAWLQEDNTVRITGYLGTGYTNMKYLFDRNFTYTINAQVNEDIAASVDAISKNIERYYIIEGKEYLNAVYHYGGFADIWNEHINDGTKTLYIWKDFKKNADLYKNDGLEYNIKFMGDIYTPESGECGVNLLITKDGVLYGYNTFTLAYTSIFYLDKNKTGTPEQKMKAILDSYFKGEAYDLTTQYYGKMPVDGKEYDSYVFTLTFGNRGPYYFIGILTPSKYVNSDYLAEAYDVDTDISINSTGYEVPVDVELDITDKKNDNNIKSLLAKYNYEMIDAYNIVLYGNKNDKHVNTIQDGVEVFIPIKGYNVGDVITIRHINDDGSLGEMLQGTVVKKNNKLYTKFTTTHFSTYALVDDILVADQDSVNIGTLYTNATEPIEKTVTITNNGENDLTIEALAPTDNGPFAVLLEKTTLAPGESTTVKILTDLNSAYSTLDGDYSGTYVITATDSVTSESFDLEIPVTVGVRTHHTSIEYTTHVQYIGWQKYVSDGAMAGTSGKAYRLEGIKIRLADQEYEGNIEYRTHIQNIGWEKNFKKNDEMSGTSGKSYRLEAIEIKLTGEIADHYDVYYRVHAENFGWLGWARNGEQSGTAGYAYRLEGIEIKLVKKGDKLDEYGKGTIFWEKGVGGTKPKPDTTPDPNPPAPQNKLVSYTTHVQNIGWQNYVSDGAMAGTEGKAYRLEGIKIKLEDQQYDGDIEYRTHIQYLGWEKNFKKNDEMSGTEGKAYRLEAIEIKLTGEMAEHYDVYYRVHAENFGWLGWAKNGEQAGTAGYAYRLEGIEIVLMEKGQTPEGYGKGNKPFYSK